MFNHSDFAYAPLGAFDVDNYLFMQLIREPVRIAYVGCREIIRAPDPLSVVRYLEFIND